jgi:hypothetical protein
MVCSSMNDYLSAVQIYLLVQQSSSVLPDQLLIVIYELCILVLRLDPPSNMNAAYMNDTSPKDGLTSPLRRLQNRAIRVMRLLYQQHSQHRVFMIQTLLPVLSQVMD